MRVRISSYTENDMFIKIESYSVIDFTRSKWRDLTTGVCLPVYLISGYFNKTYNMIDT